MESRQPRTEIVGFTLRGPEPLGTMHLRWSDGMTVLYGANGSGKTTVLSGIGSVLRGERGYDSRWLGWEQIVYVRLLDWDALIEEPNRIPQIAFYDGEFYDDWFPHIEDEVTRWILNAAHRDSPAHHEPRQRIPEQTTALACVEEYASELRSGDYLALAGGFGDRPWWDVYPALSPSSGDVGRDRLVARRAQYAYLFDVLEEHLGDGIWGSDTDVNALPLEELIADAPVSLAEVDTDLMREALVPTFAKSYDVYTFFVNLDVATGGELWIDPLDLRILTAPAWVPHTLSTVMFRTRVEGLPVPITTGPEADRQQAVIHEMITDPSDDESPDEAVERIRDEMNAWRDEADRLRNELFPLMPKLDWRVNGAAAWVEGSPIEWVAEEPTGDTLIPFEHLSESQRRAYNLVLDIARTDGNRVLLIDEPETALHRKAVSLLAERLNTFTRANGFPVIAATHSAEFLALEDAQLVHVARQFPSGKAQLVEVERQQLGEHAEQLDLTVSEMLQLVRTFIVVEGEHDRLVIDGFIGDELKALGAEIVAMRGASKVVTLADAEVIFRYTDATVLVVLDAIDDPPALVEMWNEVTRLARRGEASLAHGRIQQYRQDHRDPNYEERQILALAQQILDRGDPSRVRFFGFTAKDIIEYLDPEAFGLEEDWDSLRGEYDAYKLKKGDFKSWLHLSKGAQINQSTIKDAVDAVHWTERHNEFTDLLNRAGI